MKQALSVSNRKARADNQSALLTREEELRLIGLWNSERDYEARDKVIYAHRFLVNGIATRLRSHTRGPGLSYEDLVAEGNIGLLIAIGKFKAEFDTRFATYAQWWVISRMREYIATNSSAVKITRNRSGEAAEKPEQVDGTGYDIPRIAPTWQGPVVVSADRSISVEEDDGDTFLDRIVDETTGPERMMTHQLEASRKELLAKVIAEAGLKPKELHIVKQRFGSEEGATFREAGEDLGITAERARQVERRAIEKLGRAARRLRLRAEDILGDVC